MLRITECIFHYVCWFLFADQTPRNVATSVAFSAYLARDLDNLGLDQTVIFENVTLNEGNAYNPLVGTFHVLRAGLYFFTVTLQSFQKRRQWFTLVADRQMQTELGTKWPLIQPYYA